MSLATVLLLDRTVGGRSRLLQVITHHYGRERRSMAEESKTPLADQLEGGSWPSFVKEMKKRAAVNAASADLLGQLELSYEEKRVHWKHGGIVGVRGYGGG